MSRYIDKDALIENFGKLTVELWLDSVEEAEIVSLIGNAPTVEAVPKDFHDKTCEAMAKRHTEEIQKLMPKRGKWIDFKNGWKCSACGKWNNETTNFCPNCGADMRKEGE